jgi:DNA polymerase (family 10)
MAVGNAEIAAVFGEIADILLLENGNPFRIRAYQNAAQALAHWPDDIGTWLRAGHEATEIPGIGADLAAKIREVLDTGSASALEEMRRRVPRGLTALLGIPGLGPKKVRALHQELEISSPEQLLRAAQAGQIRSIPGFGAGSERRILEAVSAFVGQAARIPRAAAAPQAEALRSHLHQAPGVLDLEIAGSYRRGRDSVGDLDLVASSARARGVMRHFLAFDRIERILAQGPTRSSVVLKGGLQVDLRVVPQKSYGAALLYFTGSRKHVIALRRIAQKLGLKLNEYGLYRGARKIAGETEVSVYAALGLREIPPAQREDQGEIEAARVDAAVAAKKPARSTAPVPSTRAHRR